MPKNESIFAKAARRFGLELKSGRTEKRSSLENPSTPLSYPAEWLLDIFNGGRTDSGLRVSEMTALQTAAVFQCVTIIANGIASNDLNVYQRILENGRVAKKIAFDHPLFDLLNNEPNPEMTSSVWRMTMMVHILLWGNGYTEIEYNGAGKIIALWPRNPSRTRPVRITQGITYQGTYYPVGTLMYETYETMGDSQVIDSQDLSDKFGTRRIVLAEDMLHIPGLSLDGRVGQDVIILARQAVGLSLATEKYAAKFFGNGAIPTGLLTAPGDMSEIQWETLRRSWNESHGGENSHRTGVLPPGVVYTKTGATPNEGQMLESRAAQVAEIARFFNVPPHMVGINADDAGKSTVEQSSIEFGLFCLGPHIVKWQQELQRKLFHKVGQAANKYIAAFDTRKLMYPDAESRSAFYGSGKQWGYLTTNDIHELEGMNPVEDGSGDKLWMPNNMVDAGMAATHSDMVTDGLNDGTLSATPSNVTPVGNHPVKQDEKKLDKADKAHDLEKTKVTSAASVAIAKHTGKSASNEQDGKQPAGKPKAKKREDVIRVFGKIFRDAVGRASFRKKPTAADYISIFGPLVSAMAEMVHEEPIDSSEFIRGFITDLFTQYGEGWSEDLDATSSAQLEKLVELLQRA